jgi:quercetin dioxygenase-like cupin family protein
MDRNEILQSGLLELYSLGSLEGGELELVQKALAEDPSLRHELNQIEEAYFLYAQANSIPPHPSIKPLLMAKIEYLERLSFGEVPVAVPLLTPDSKIEDFEFWLNRMDMQLRHDFDGMQAIILADEPEKLTALVWLKDGAPDEIHTTEHERFLVVEGSCDFTVGNNVHTLRRGDYLSIPLHVSHEAKVTSGKPCKIILQRVKV